MPFNLRMRRGKKRCPTKFIKRQWQLKAVYDIRCTAYDTTIKCIRFEYWIGCYDWKSQIIYCIHDKISLLTLMIIDFAYIVNFVFSVTHFALCVILSHPYIHICIVKPEYIPCLMSCRFDAQQTSDMAQILISNTYFF